MFSFCSQVTHYCYYYYSTGVQGFVPLSLVFLLSYSFTSTIQFISSHPIQILFFLCRYSDNRVSYSTVSPDTCRAEISDVRFLVTAIFSARLSSRLSHDRCIPRLFLTNSVSFSCISAGLLVSPHSSHRSLHRRFDRAGRIPRSVGPVRGAALVPTQRLPQYNTSNILYPVRIRHVLQG